MHKLLVIATILIALALVTAGCGGGGGAGYQAGEQGSPGIELTITAPVDGGCIDQGAVQTIAASASAAQGIHRVEFFIDAVRIATDYSAPYSTNWDTAGYSVSVHTLTVSAYDLEAPSNSASESIAVCIWDTGGGGPPAPPIIFGLN